MLENGLRNDAVNSCFVFIAKDSKDFICGKEFKSLQKVILFSEIIAKDSWLDSYRMTNFVDVFKY